MQATGAMVLAVAPPSGCADDDLARRRQALLGPLHSRACSRVGSTPGSDTGGSGTVTAATVAPNAISRRKARPGAPTGAGRHGIPLGRPTSTSAATTVTSTTCSR